MTRFSILLSALATLILGAGAANAAPRDVYTISNIPVDETAATSQAAESQAVASAQISGLYRLVQKLTLPEDRATIGEDFYAYENARNLAAAVDVDDVRRSTTVYRATLSVLYNPTQVRSQLNARGIAFVDQQAPRSMIVPTGNSAVALEAWRATWPASNEGALNPFVTALASYTSGSDWGGMADEANAVGARNAVIAELNGSEGSYTVSLYRVSSAGRFTIGTTGPVESLPEAVAAASAYLDAAWKRQSIVRADELRSSTEATIRFSSIRNWNSVRTALSTSPLISDFQIDAVARDGALVSFAYAGNRDRLAQDLRQSGILLSETLSGWTMQMAGDSGF
ncbi:MAG: hypothetical protein CMK09_07470 [Ponticaulis sp.]|nr:hypothetical protein [Ponticaulis sp.]|tara:strand:- start:35628 stop:36647 length:1020 start_codon:yes stop_codon:yes gene_type:complete